MNLDNKMPATVKTIDNFPDIDYYSTKKAALVLRAINHRMRQEIIKILEKEGRINVTQLYVKLRLEQSVASQHLALLRKAGIVCTERDGKCIYYTISKERIENINRFVAALFK